MVITSSVGAGENAEIALPLPIRICRKGSHMQCLQPIIHRRLPLLHAGGLPPPDRQHAGVVSRAASHARD